MQEWHNQYAEQPRRESLDSQESSWVSNLAQPIFHAGLPWRSPLTPRMVYTNGCYQPMYKSDTVNALNCESLWIHVNRGWIVVNCYGPQDQAYWLTEADRAAAVSCPSIYKKWRDRYTEFTRQVSVGSRESSGFSRWARRVAAAGRTARPTDPQDGSERSAVAVCPS